MAKQAPWFDRNKEKLLFAASLLIAVLAVWGTFGSGETTPKLSAEPKVDKPPNLGAVLAAKKLFASGSYWEETGARFVFAEPEKVRIFKPVDLEVPTVEPPKIVMPLPDPGPLLRYSGDLPRLDGSLPVRAEPEADGAAPAGDGDEAGAGAEAGGGE